MSDFHHCFKPSRWRQPPRVTRNPQPQQSPSATRCNHSSKCTRSHSQSHFDDESRMEMSGRCLLRLTRMTNMSKYQERCLGAGQTLFLDVPKRIEPLELRRGALCTDWTCQSGWLDVPEPAFGHGSSAIQTRFECHLLIVNGHKSIAWAHKSRLDSPTKLTSCHMKSSPVGSSNVFHHANSDWTCPIEHDLMHNSVQLTYYSCTNASHGDISVCQPRPDVALAHPITTVYLRPIAQPELCPLYYVWPDATLGQVQCPIQRPVRY
jgi:hypothetical protein